VNVGDYGSGVVLAFLLCFLFEMTSRAAAKRLGVGYVFSDRGYQRITFSISLCIRC
jgi:hypothetical protein